MHQPKNSESLRRKKPKQSPFPIILIVCEGTKTEPNYFKNIRRRHHLSSAHVVIAKNDCGSAPVSIVECAKKLCREENAEEVYCVFDRDDHVSFDAAKNQITALNESKKWPSFKGIFSDPCFELWIILHFIYSTKQYARTGDKSKCDLVNDDLAVQFPEYKKCIPNLYDLTYMDYGKAVKNAMRLEKHHKATGTTTPCTNIYELTDRLRDFHKKNLTHNLT